MSTTNSKTRRRSTPRFCPDCHRRYQAWLERRMRDWLRDLRRRKAAAAEHARQLAQLPVAERRAIRAAESREARAELLRRIAARAAKRPKQAEIAMGAAR